MPNITVRGITYEVEITDTISTDDIEMFYDAGPYFATLTVDHQKETISVYYTDGSEVWYPYSEYNSPIELAIWAAATAEENTTEL